MKDQNFEKLSLWNNTDPISNSTYKWLNSSFIPDNETDVESLLEEKETGDIREQLQKFYPILALGTILLALFVIYLFILLTLWERYGMDPMKRGITNRVSLSF